MNPWWKRIRAGLGMGLIWAAGGAAVGGLIELIANFVPALNFVDMWIPLFAIPGFVGGMIFSAVIGIAARHRRFEELSLRLFAAWGALGGLVLVLLAAVVGWGGPYLAIPFVLMSAGGAAGSLAIARMAERRSALDAGASRAVRSEAHEEERR
jgi:hypothetical protein